MNSKEIVVLNPCTYKKVYGALYLIKERDFGYLIYFQNALPRIYSLCTKLKYTWIVCTSKVGKVLYNKPRRGIIVPANE